MAGSQTLRFDIVGDGSSAARAFRQTADNAELAARGARHAADALEIQRKTASASARASESLAKSDDILTEVEHRLRDGALEAELALKRETAAKKASARASAEAEAADSRLSKVSKSLKGGFSGSLLGALPAAIPAVGGLIGPVAAVTAGLGGAAVAAGAFGLLAKSSFSQVSGAASAYSKAQAKLAASPATAPAATAAQLASARASLAAAEAAEKNAKGHAAMTAAQARVTAAQDRLNALETQGTKVSAQRTAALKAEKSALDGLTPAQKTMVTSLQGIQTQWKALAATVTTPALAAWLSAANDGLKFMKPLVEPVASVFATWGQTIDTYFKSGAGSAELTKIATALGNFGADQIRDIGVFLFDVGSAVKHLGADLAGHNVDFEAFGNHLVTWGNAFRAWSESAAARKDVGAFLDWVRSNGRTVSDLLGSIAKSTPNLFAGLSGAGTLELKAITDFFGLVANLPPWAQKWIGEGLPLFLVGSKVLPAVGAMTGLVGKAITLLKTPAPTWLGGAGKTAAAGEGAAAGEAGAAGTAGAAGATAAGKTLGGLIGKGLLAGLVAALDVGLNKVIDHALGKNSSAAGFAKAGGEAISGAVIGAMVAGPYGAAAGAIVGLIVGVFTNPKVRHDISGAFDLVRHDTAHIWDLTVRDTRIAWNDLYGATIGVAIRIGHNVETQWDSLRHGTASAFDHIRHDTATAMNDVYGGTVGVAIRLGHNVETQWDSLRHSTANIFNGVRHDIASIWDTVWSNTVGRASRGVGDVVRWVGGLPGKLGNIFRSAGGWLVGHGGDIIHGLFNGITGALSSVGTWVHAHIFSPIIGAVKSLFGIHSPSTVMADIGGHLVNGLIKGLITSGSGLTSLVGKVFGGMPTALLHLLEKGFIGAGKLPGKALGALKGLGADALKGLKGIGGSLLNDALGVGGDLGSFFSGLFGGGGNYKPGAGVNQWAGLVNQALAMEHLPASLASSVLYQMQTESGGNPGAQNNTDINAQLGTPSKGLMQVIQPTFARWHWPGTSSNIFDPLANIAAALNYAEHGRGFGSRPGQLGSGHGYANGTSSAAPGWAWVGERGKELMHFRGGEQVIPNHFLPRGGGSSGTVTVVLQNQGVIGSKAELDNWLNDSINNLARTSRLRYALTQSPSAR